MSTRIRKIHSSLSQQSSLKTQTNRPRRIRVFPRGREEAQAVVGEVVDHYLVTQRKTLEDVEPIRVLRWLLRKYFEWRGFACRSHCGECDGKCYASIEYRGTFDDQGAARWAANQHGGEVKPIPFNSLLPAETVRYGVGDVPVSEASQFYRKGVALPFIAVPREKLAQLEAKVEQVFRSASA